MGSELPVNVRAKGASGLSPPQVAKITRISGSLRGGSDEGTQRSSTRVVVVTSTTDEEVGVNGCVVGAFVESSVVPSELIVASGDELVQAVTVAITTPRQTRTYRLKRSLPN
jgi:hypothetical protein